MLFVVVFWAANFIVVKAANEQIPPIAFAFLRFGLAAVVLLVALRIREGSIALPRRDIVPVLGLGALGFGVYQILWATALQDIPAGDSAMLVAATPVLTALLAVVSGADVLTRTKLLGSLVSFAGVGLVVASEPGFGLTSSIGGDLLTLGATLCWSVYTAFGAPILRRHSPLRTTAWAMVGGSLVLAVPGLFQASTTDWGAVGTTAWLGLLYSSLIPAGLSNVLIFHAIRLLGPTRIVAYQFLVPFSPSCSARSSSRSPFGIDQLLGGVVIVLGVAVTRSDRAGDLAGWLRSRMPA